MDRSITMIMVLLSVMAIANASYLYPQFYDHSCPQAKNIVQSVVAKAVAKEARMAASLLRLHFHDCFVKVCSLLQIHFVTTSKLMLYVAIKWSLF